MIVDVVWWTGCVRCRGCGWEWVAVWPNTTAKLECPLCRKILATPLPGEDAVYWWN